MGIKYRPIFRTKWGSLTPKGFSIRSGIPGLGYQHKFSQASLPVFNKESLPTVAKSIRNVIGFTILISIGVIFWGLIYAPLGYAVGLLSLSLIYKPLFRNHVSGVKEQPVYTSDARFKTGQRFEGMRQVEDPDNPVELTLRQRTISRVEGTVKLVVVGTVLIFFYTYLNTQRPTVVKDASIKADSATKKPATKPVLKHHKKRLHHRVH